MHAVHEHSHYYSLIIIGLITFVGDSSRGVIFPVLWPLCQKLGGSQVDYGLLVSMFSLGRLIVSTPLGYISDLYRHRMALMLSGIILTFGSLLWIYAPSTGTILTLYLAQFLLGVGTGSLGVTRSYVAEQTEPSQRTYMLARLSALQYAGFAATPLAGSALAMLGAVISATWAYTLPGYLLLLLSLICLGLLIYPFQDIQKMYQSTNIEPEIAEMEGIDNVPHASNLEEGNCTFNSIKSSMAKSNKSLEMKQLVGVTSLNNTIEVIKIECDDATNEVVLSVKEHYDINCGHSSSNTEKMIFSNDDVTCCTDDLSQHDNTIITDTDSIHTTITSVTTNSLCEKEDKQKNRVYMLLMFLNFTTRGGIAVYETQGAQIMLDVYKLPQWELGLLVSVSGIIGTIQLMFFKQFWTAHFSDMTLMIGGIALFALSQAFFINWGPDRQTSLLQYLVAMYIVYAVSYPIANSAVLGMFSNIQKSGKQAKAQGQFALMGSLARVVMPTVTKFMERYIEYASSFAMVMILMAVSLIGIVALFDEINYITTSSSISSSSSSLSAKVQYTLFTQSEKNPANNHGNNFTNSSVNNSNSNTSKKTVLLLLLSGFSWLATFLAIMAILDWGYYEE